MSILLVASGGLFALLFILITVTRAAQGREKVSFFETLLAFLALTLPLLALVNNNVGEQSLPLVNVAPIGIAIIVIVVSFMTLFIEWRKSKRAFNQRRGVLGIGIGVLLIAATLIVPLSSRLISLPPMMGTGFIGNAPASSGDLVNIVDSGRSSDETSSASAMQILVEETGLDSDQINARLNAGETIASIVADTGGDLEKIVGEITTTARKQIEIGIADGSVPQAQAGMIMGNLENMIRQGVNGELPQMVYDQLFVRLLSSDDAPPPPPLMPTNTPVVIAVQQSPTPTRLPSATPTPTNTPYLLVSPTPGAVTNELQPDTVEMTTCLAIVQNNLNLRSGPGTDFELLLTIPSGTTLNASARDEESSWWVVQYQGQTGWVSGDYLTLGASCGELPVNAE